MATGGVVVEGHAAEGEPSPQVMAASAREVLEAHWRDPGFTCPNGSTYPWLWLWDSCFHSVVWAELGDAERAVSELRVALEGRDADGFLPHVRYLDGSTAHASFWGRVGSSSITQPPVYGWAIEELGRRGVEVPGDLVESAVECLRFLVERRRRTPGGLVEIVHPWETGCDHSPRWDDVFLEPQARDADPYDEQVWFRRKGELLDGVHRSTTGAPLWNDQVAVGSVAFSAVVADAARRLSAITGDRVLAEAWHELADALGERWHPDLRTWVDDGPTAGGSGRIRTAEALLGVLVDRRPEAVAAVAAEVLDEDGLGGAFGPAQVHRGEPRFRRGSYWRGPSWPQLDLLLWVGLHEAGEAAAAAFVARGTRRGAWRSGWAEYWDPDTAAPGGAVPQSWATLALCLPPS